MKESKQFNEDFKSSGYAYSDQFLYEMIQDLKNEVNTLKNKIESDGR